MAERREVEVILIDGDPDIELHTSVSYDQDDEETAELHGRAGSMHSLFTFSLGRKIHTIRLQSRKVR